MIPLVITLPDWEPVRLQPLRLGSVMPGDRPDAEPREAAEKYISTNSPRAIIIVPDGLDDEMDVPVQGPIVTLIPNGSFYLTRTNLVKMAEDQCLTRFVGISRLPGG